MKKLTIKSISVLAFIAMLSNCTTIKDIEYTVKENPLQMHADEVTLEVSGKFVEKGLTKLLQRLLHYLFVMMALKLPLLQNSFKDRKLPVTVR